MTKKRDSKKLRNLADSVDAANAFAKGEIEYLDETAELPPPPEIEPMVMRGVRLRSASTSASAPLLPRPAFLSRRSYVSGSSWALPRWKTTRPSRCPHFGGR